MSDGAKEALAFVQWAVPRTDRTKVFIPHICGMVLTPM